MKHIGRKWRGILVATTLVLSQFSLVSGASAQINTVKTSLFAAEPTTYSHATGGGLWNLGRQNVDVRRSLEGEEFACDDVVSYLTKFEVPNTSDLIANGNMTFDIKYSISMDTTGESGAALGEPVVAQFNAGDPANIQKTVNSSASIIDTSQSGAMFSKGAVLFKTVRLTGVEAGETLILRVDTQIHCLSGSMPSGNLQFKLMDGAMSFKNGTQAVNPPESLNTGEQTIPLQKVQELGVPSITIAKTVTTQFGSCPGEESITIEPTQYIKFCYAVTNDSNSGGKLGAPLYNLSQIADDNGIYPNFNVSLTSGLTDIDGDSQADDLAIGATAYAEYVEALDGTQDSVVTNIATVYGFDSPTGGVQYQASDTATVNIDAPAPLISINKLTNGSDGAYILVGSAINWTYVVSNTGDRLLTNVYVTDNQGVSVTCPKNTLAISESMTCTGSGTAVAGSYVNIGTAHGTWDSTEVTTTDDSSYFGANPAIDIQKTPDSQTVIEGQKATFTITVTNTGNVDLTDVAVTDALSSGCDANIGSLLVAANSTYTCESPVISADLTNVAVVTGYFGTTQVSDNDSANVVVDYLPNIEVSKSADPTSVLETGGSVTFTFSVKNIAPEDFTLTSLTDDKFGDLNGQGTCVLPQTIAASATYSCTLTKTLSSDSLTTHVDVVTASGHDPQNHPASGSDDASVTFIDVLPTISVTKVANPTIVRSTGGTVVYTIKITNTGPETVTVTALIDPAITLSTECLALIGQQIAIGSFLQCNADAYLVIGAGNSFTNTATATAQDNEGNQTTASGTAVVKSYWYGRTPGYWKNHAEAWTSGYLPANKVQDIFTIPTSLLTSGILDLDKNGSKDSLMSALAYKGGTTLAGAAQILLRASVAALLNEVYYGADYPAETSTAALIAHVNSVLATLNRDAYLALATTYDLWNNGVETVLP